MMPLHQSSNLFEAVGSAFSLPSNPQESPKPASSQTMTTTRSNQCECGGESLPILTTDGRIKWPQYFCPNCEHKYTKMGDPKQGGAWAYEPLQIPMEYTKTIIEKIPCKKMQDVATNWAGWENGRSLLLHGTTRLGKTRAAWEVTRRHWKGRYKKQICMTMRGFERMIEDGFNKHNHSKLIDELIVAPYLYIDDLGKERTTQRVACDLFAVIDERTINHRPTIITTNFTSSGLLARFDDAELGAALIGRFKDYFDCIGASKE